ncbi:MAG TPA: cupin domain-containing protein [Chitinophagaceae bacterium]|nr:cupin domain-containing protein [Chitinophagaceae bacterium]
MLLHHQLIQQYNLQPHPEGGWYKQTYKSNESIRAEALPERFGGDRPFSTAIYFLLEKGNFSAFHRIKSDECWHFYHGDPLEIFVLQQNGELTVTTLGNDISKGYLFQYIVPAGCWFASRPAPGSQYCFVGCTVAPGFDFADFEIADAKDLIKQFPKHNSFITELCRY